MCLDADSYIATDALRKAVRYFEDERVMALAANVRIIRSGGLLNLVQVFEYVVSYQMKKALTVLNIEYIIGGIGSTFRRAHLERVGFYDTNTVTEDIDLSMKILRDGNNVVRVIYGSDVIAYTESVIRISDLIKQRYRWKWGRCQTFLKNREMFFSTDGRFTKGLVWVYLPLAVVYELTFLIEPVMLAFIFSIIVVHRDYLTLASALGLISFYIMMNIISEETLSMAEKIQLIVLAPGMYLAFYLISFAEYVALLKSLANARNLKRSLATHTHTWTSPQRVGTDHRQPLGPSGQ
jgi:cellulose synthase/poly-beta-1,6-N-acetylglucosamine synthase-like glycosyltransferase